MSVRPPRTGKITSTGQWRGALRLPRNHRSSHHKNAPMPCAKFQGGPYVVRATGQVTKPDRPASAGCVRLHTDIERVLFNRVRAKGKANLR
ncbi:MAG: hypothetical protein JXR75_12260 [Rhodobacteraceae bacterium]|nr:hypothetical protein [Paracoccaceae bacterium]